jgi:hypothetical protein
MLTNIHINRADVSSAGIIDKWLAIVDTSGIMTLHISHSATTTAYTSTVHGLTNLIRKAFETEVKVSLSKIIHTTDLNRAQLHTAALARHDKLKGAAYRDGFNPYIPQSTARGHVLLEPFSAVEAEVPVTACGTSYDDQGLPTAKRLRLVGESSITGRTVFYKVSVEPDLEAARYRQLAPARNIVPPPVQLWSEFRMLAGAIEEAPPILDSLILGMVNMMSTGAGIELGGGGQPPVVPVIVTPNDMDEILKIVIGDTESYAMAPMWADRIVEEVGKLIGAKKHNTNDLSIAPLLRLAGYNEALRGLISQLVKDPILFVRGAIPARIPERHAEDLHFGVPSATKSRVLPGFDPATLGTITIADRFSVGFIDAEVAQNTLYNLLGNPGANMVVRLSDWTKAMASRTGNTLRPEMSDATTDDTSLIAAPWLSQVGKHDLERRYRLSLATDELNDLEKVGLGDIGFDSPFQPYELDMRVGDNDQYWNEIGLVMQLTMINLLSSGPPTDIVKSEWYDNSDQPAVSSASRFLIDNAISVSIGKERLLSSHSAISAFMASTVPFAVKDVHSVTFINNVMHQCKSIVEPMLRDGLHYIAVGAVGGSRKISDQPIQTSVSFSQTTSPDFTWSSGSEMTAVIEGFINCIHFIVSLEHNAAYSAVAGGKYTVDAIVKLLTGGCRGLHYSNLMALCRTIFAVEIGVFATASLNKITANDTRWPGEGIPWAVDSGIASQSALLLRTLKTEHDDSNMRHQSIPLVNDVWTRVRGPGAAALETTCTVHQIGKFLYRTDHFRSMEVDMLARLMLTINSTLTLPHTAVRGCLAQRYREGRVFRSVNDILLALSSAASIIARILQSLNDIDEITRRTSTARDTKSTASLQQQLQIQSETLLYNTR